MDEGFAKQLCQLNNRFYEENAQSFSQTRHSGWPGWEKCLEAVGLGSQALRLKSAGENSEATGSGIERSGTAELEALGSPKGLHVADLACGNLRFEAFLQQALPSTPLSVVALDACESLPVSRSDTRFVRCDLIEELSRGTLGETLGKATAAGNNNRSGHPAEGFDLAVCFGFMHHIPLPEWRARLIEAMLHAVKPGGFACVSFWRFADDEGLAEKALRTHAEGCDELNLDPAAFNAGDYLLGWKNRPGAYRYCHSFTDADIDGLVAALPPNAKTAARFRADGRTGSLNEYLVLQRA